MIFAETAIWSVTGLALGMVVFIIGGFVWAHYEIDRTSKGTPLRGPVLRLIGIFFSLSSEYRLPGVALVSFLGAAFLGGSPGVGLVLKQQGSKRIWPAAVAASTVYAATWAVIHWYRPRIGIPFGLWPDLTLLQKPLRAIIWLMNHK